jgi:hypothetical protein
MAQSQLAVVQADFVAVLKKVTESRETFALLTGLGSDAEIDTAETQELAGLKELEEYLGRALARSDVLALEKEKTLKRQRERSRYRLPQAFLPQASPETFTPTAQVQTRAPTGTRD